MYNTTRAFGQGGSAVNAISGVDIALWDVIGKSVNKPIHALISGAFRTTSCGARRVVETAAPLVDHVLPHSAVRQWVLSFPYPLRFVLANHPEVMGNVLAIVNRAISTYLRGPT